MKQIATTIEQSKRLIACGVAPKSADMCRLFYDADGDQVCYDETYSEDNDEHFLLTEYYGEDNVEVSCELVPKSFGDYDHSFENDSPAWSLSALLALLPDSIKRNEYSTYDLELSKTSIAYVYYADMDSYLNPHEKLHLYSDDLIEACVKAIEWLTANGYELNEL